MVDFVRSQMQGYRASVKRCADLAAPKASREMPPVPKKIIFINPPYERIAPGYDFLRHITNRSPSLGLLHLAAEVRLRGYQPSIVESDMLDLTADEVADRVIAEKPAYVGITLFTVGVWGAGAIARKIKKALPDTVIIVGGPHISSMGPETIRRFQELDMAVNGECERPLMDPLNALECTQSLAGVPSIVCRYCAKI